MSTKTPTKPELTADQLREVLIYDAETGVFTWRNASRRCVVGAVAGSMHGAGYRQIRLLGRLHLSHRLAWLYVYGEWPVNQIDHINGERTDNRIANLRQATNAENCQNVRAHSDGCGLIGVTWSKSKRKWVSGIGINGTRKYLGYFDTAQAAHERYLEAKSIVHPFGANRHV